VSETLRYRMVIAWSEEDEAYLVGLPDWEDRVLNWETVTHGFTYEEAARNGQDVLEMLIEGELDEGKELPAARTYQAPLTV
jgi:antitoxin HicB